MSSLKKQIKQQNEMLNSNSIYIKLQHNLLKKHVQARTFLIAGLIAGFLSGFFFGRKKSILELASFLYFISMNAKRFLRNAKKISAYLTF